MAIGLVMTGDTKFQWLGQKVTAFVDKQIDQRLQTSGFLWLQQSRALAPFKTGELKAREDFKVEGKELTLILGAPYDIFTEFGTRYMSPREHVRPALNAIGRVWGTSVTMQFNVPHVTSPMLYHKGKFIVPSGIQAKPLTHAQRQHVEHHLVPSAKQHYRGNVKWAKFVVRRVG